MFIRIVGPFAGIRSGAIFKKAPPKCESILWKQVSSGFVARGLLLLERLPAVDSLRTSLYKYVNRIINSASGFCKWFKRTVLFWITLGRAALGSKNPKCSSLQKHTRDIHDNSRADDARDYNDNP